MRKKRTKTKRRPLGVRLEALEDRLALDGTGLANACPPDLDVSGMNMITGDVGQAIQFSLLNQGATVSDDDGSGGQTGDNIRFVLDPDDNPSGATITSAGAFDWTPDAAGTFEFVVIAIDEGSPRLADAEVFSITVEEPTMSAPTIDLNGDDAGEDFQTSFTEGNDEVPVVADTAMLSDDGTVSQVVATITNISDSGSEVLAASGAVGTGVSASYVAATGTLTLQGDADASVYQDILRTMTYVNNATDPTTGERTIEITVTDTDSQTAMATASVDVVAAANSAPELNDIADQTVEVGGDELIVVVSAVDVDGDQLVFNLDPEDAPEDAILLNNADGTATISWTPDVDDVGDVLFRVLVTDDDATDPRSDQTTFTVTVTPGDQSPILDLDADSAGTGSTATFVEEGAPIAIAEMATISDPNDTELASATVVLSNAPDGNNEQLGADVSGTNISANFDVATRTLALTGSDTLANWQQVLRNVQYTNTADEPDLTDREITVFVSDGVDDSEVATAVVSIEASNDAPMLVLGGPATVDININDTVSFTSSATDNESAANELVYTVGLANSGIQSGEAIPTITQPNRIEAIVFDTPTGATEAGVATSFGDSYQLRFDASPGDRLSFATMLVQTNDWFISPSQSGIELFDGDGNPLSGTDITSQLMVWDAGTEIDQTPGSGADQAPRQTGPDTGADDPDNTVRVVAGQDAADFVIATVDQVDGQFELTIINNTFNDPDDTMNPLNSDLPTPLAPGVAVIHSGDAPIFTEGAADRDQGLESLAEDGDPSGLAAALPGAATVGGEFLWTPSSVGTFPIAVQVTDPQGAMDEIILTVNVLDGGPPTIIANDSATDVVFSELDQDERENEDSETSSLLNQILA